MYDLLIRDATVVSSTGRRVADVAIEGGRVAYVGPTPPKRKAKEEIAGMGRFLVPGVIDTASQLDPGGDPARWEAESRASASGGVTATVLLPGGPDPITDAPSARRRMERGIGRSWVHFGLWGKVDSGNAEALLEADRAGLILGLLSDGGARSLEPLAACRGVLSARSEGPDATAALLDLARRIGRPLHLAHVSTAAELQILDPVRGPVPVTTGVTPHHLFFSEEGLNGLADRMRGVWPPIRPDQDRKTLWTAIKRGRLDVIGSDHHAEEGAPGIPGAELLFPLLLSAVRFGRLSLETVVALCCETPARMFGLEGKGKVVAGADADLVLFAEADPAKVDASALLSGAVWSPYADREAAPKPEIVVIDGRVVSRKGRVVEGEARGRFLGRIPA